MGGDAARVAAIVEARTEWDQEVIEELLRWGAKPRLVRVKRVLDIKYPSACCDFVQPDGREVHNVWLPLGVLLVEYPEHARHVA